MNKLIIYFLSIFSFNILSLDISDRIVIAKEVVNLDDTYTNVEAIDIKTDRSHSSRKKTDLIG